MDSPPRSFKLKVTHTLNEDRWKPFVHHQMLDACSKGIENFNFGKIFWDSVIGATRRLLAPGLILGLELRKEVSSFHHLFSPSIVTVDHSK
jgi:hypothetical protein